MHDLSVKNGKPVAVGGDNGLAISPTVNWLRLFDHALSSIAIAKISDLNFYGRFMTLATNHNKMFQ